MLTITLDGEHQELELGALAISSSDTSQFPVVGRIEWLGPPPTPPAEPPRRWRGDGGNPTPLTPILYAGVIACSLYAILRERARNGARR